MTPSPAPADVLTRGGDQDPRQDRALRIGVIFEDLLGHGTFIETLRTAVDSIDDAVADWHPMRFPVRGQIERLPLLRRNWSLRCSARARAVLARHRRDYDVLLFHTQIPAMLSVGVMRRVPSVISLDATPRNIDEIAAGYLHAAGPPIIEALKQRIVSRPLNAARMVVAWSEWVQRSLIEDYRVAPRQITLIPAGTTMGQPASGRPAQRRPGAPRLLFVGGDFVRKGGLVLLKALGQFAPGGCETHLVTQSPVADGPGLVVHRDLKPNSPELKQLYLDADMFVLPTLADSFGHVIIEAMAAGLPVISTRVGAIPEIVRHGQTGLLVAPDDADGLASAIGRLIAHPTLALEMGRRAQSIAARDYDARLNAARVIDLLRRVA